MLLDFRRKKEQLAHCVTIADILTKEGDLSEIVAAVGQPERAKDESVASVDEDVVKDTKTISLDFFMDGLTIEEIAKKKRYGSGYDLWALDSFCGNRYRCYRFD